MVLEKFDSLRVFNDEMILSGPDFEGTLSGEDFRSGARRFLEEARVKVLFPFSG